MYLDRFLRIVCCFCPCYKDKMLANSNQFLHQASYDYKTKNLVLRDGGISQKFKTRQYLSNIHYTKIYKIFGWNFNIALHSRLDDNDEYIIKIMVFFFSNLKIKCERHLQHTKTTWYLESRRYIFGKFTNAPTFFGDYFSNLHFDI